MAAIAHVTLRTAGLFFMLFLCYVDFFDDSVCGRTLAVSETPFQPHVFIRSMTVPKRWIAGDRVPSSGRQRRGSRA